MFKFCFSNKKESEIFQYYIEYKLLTIQSFSNDKNAIKRFITKISIEKYIFWDKNLFLPTQYVILLNKYTHAHYYNPFIKNVYC